VPQLEILVVKLATVNRTTTGSIVIGEITTLTHLGPTSQEKCQFTKHFNYINRLKILAEKDTNPGMILWNVEPWYP
jgi:hypothetical protein